MAIDRENVRLWLTAFAFLAALAFASTFALAQGAPASAGSLSTSGPYRIAGVVVSGVTGEPIRRASVAALTEADSHTVATVLTDDEGRFSLNGLAAAKYRLTAAKRGYRNAYFDEHDEYSSAIVTGDGQDPTGLTFKLMPGAVLRGTVTGDGGDAVEGARVFLFERPRGHRLGDHIAQADATTTDDTGAYEFSNLAAGDYLVAVKAEPWYSLHRSFGADGGRSASDAAAALDVAYPITFFDSTTDESGATAIPLAAGEREEAQISLHAVPALRLQVQAPHREGESIARPELRQSIFGTQVSAESVGLFDAMRTGTVEYTGVAPGHYELEQGDPPRLVELDATASQQIDPALGTPTVEISGTVKSASGEALPPGVTVALESVDEEHRHEPMQMNAGKGTFRFGSVPPGKWTVTVESQQHQLPVVSIAAGNRTRAGSVLTVGDKPMQIVLTVSQGGIRVGGFARKGGKGFAGAMVVLTPKDLSLMRELARRDQSDSDGSFSLRDVTPGQYTVVAIENGWELDWSRPEVIARFLPKGTPVKVTDAATPVVVMPGTAEVQTP
jgi:hypothetical protein